jgi:hypothetical protein
MTSADPEVDDVHRLHREGLSIRAIADRLGLSRMKVHRTLTAVPDDWDDDEGDEDRGRFDDYEPVPPFRFVGLATPEDRRGNPLKDGNGRVFPPSPRALDGRGVSVPNPDLEIWRWCAHAHGERDSEGAERVPADWARQLAEAGVWCDERGRWVQRPRAV